MPATFFVDRFAAVAEVEPNQSPRAGQLVTLPATITGTLAEAGDVDFYRLNLSEGQQVGVQLIVSGGKLDAVLRMLDVDGTVLAESTRGVLGFTAQRKGVYALGVHDREYKGGKD